MVLRRRDSAILYRALIPWIRYTDFRVPAPEPIYDPTAFLLSHYAFILKQEMITPVFEFQPGQRIKTKTATTTTTTIMIII